MQNEQHYRFAEGGVIAADAPAELRTAFIRKTYAHLGAAVLAFVGLELLLFKSGLGRSVGEYLLVNRGVQIIVLLAFMVVGYIASRFASSGASPAKQYLGLGIYVVVEALIFLPLLTLAAYYSKQPNIIGEAGIYTGLIFGGLTAVVFLTKKDFSFMRGALAIGMFALIGVGLCSMLFGFSLGTLYSGAVVLLMGGYILYYTSNVMHHYPIGSHVAASLALFSALATLFWYILRILMDRR